MYFLNTLLLFQLFQKLFVFDKYFLEKWIKYLPNAEVKHFPNAGHYILEDEPQEVIKEIEIFLNNNRIE